MSRYTSQDCAILCIQVPISEISCPPKKSWKLRCLSARNVTGRFWRGSVEEVLGTEEFLPACCKVTFNDAVSSAADATSPKRIFLASPEAVLALDWLLMTSAEQNRIERRSGQRFPYQIPVLLRVPAESRTGTGCTQDLSSRGALVWTDFPLKEGTAVEMVLVMPSEITLGEDMNVCCHAHVMRLERVEGSKPAVAIKIERYEFMQLEATALQQHALREEHVVR